MTTPHELACGAADYVRRLTDRTTKPDAYPYPTDVHHTLGALAGLLEQLPLALHQAALALNAIPDDQLAVLADPPTPTAVRARVASELGQAIASAQQAATHLRAAQHAAAELVYTGPIPGL